MKRFWDIFKAFDQNLQLVVMLVLFVFTLLASRVNELETRVEILEKSQQAFMTYEEWLNSFDNLWEQKEQGFQVSDIPPEEEEPQPPPKVEPPPRPQTLVS